MACKYVTNIACKHAKAPIEWGYSSDYWQSLGEYFMTDFKRFYYFAASFVGLDGLMAVSS